MSQISEINDQIIEYILKTDEFYEALWGKEDFVPESTITEPNDFNCGAIANALEYVYQFIEEITEPDISLLDDPYLDIVVFFFTGLTRFFGESNVDLITRMSSLLVREDIWRSEKLGTPWDIINVLSYYLPREFMYYIPNTVLTDLMVNGNFEVPIGAEWTILPATEDRTDRNAFSGDYKISFTTIDSISQTISVTAGSFILNSFARPAFTFTGDTADLFNLQIQRDSDSFYYDVDAETWGASIVDNTYTTESQDYALAEFFIIVDGSYDITLTFTKIIDSFIDRIEFGEKLYPAFQILYIDIGGLEGFGSLWDTAETNYDDASYLDQDYMFDTATSSYSDTYYQSLIDITKAAGVLGEFISEIRAVDPDIITGVLATSDGLQVVTSDSLNIEVNTL